MLTEFQTLEANDPHRMERVRAIISHLLRNQFMHVDDRGSGTLLSVLGRRDTERLVADYFEIAGYRLVVRESEGWAGILPDIEQTGQQRMRIDETLLLLLLRRIWEENIQDGRVERHGSVLSSLNQAYAAYEDMVARARRAAIGIGEFRSLIEGLERRAIVRLGLADDELDDIPLTIRALVATVAGDEFMLHLSQLLARPDYQPDEDEAETDVADDEEEDQP